ncbi:MAG: 2-dehydropantoate 2-reductase [Gammaproteobacteria bacterium]
MKICVYGAGAIGGLLGARLWMVGQDVTLIARGAHLRAMQKRGLRLRSGGETHITHPRVMEDPAQAGEQDFVIVALKAHSVPAIVDAMLPLLGPRTAVVSAVNGVPWWYFYRLEGPWENTIVQSVDPGGAQWRKWGPQRAIGCVVYPACEIVEPGVIEHLNGDRFIIGEPNGEKTAPVRELSQALIQAGFKAPIRRIRDEIWVKLWGNLCFNPLSALTHGTLEQLANDPGTRAIARAMMREGQAIGERLGVRFGVDVEQRIDGAAAVGAHKTSMLQDLERGRPMEIDALVTAVQELGKLVDVATPTIDLVLALVQQRARLAGCYAGPP